MSSSRSSRRCRCSAIASPGGSPYTKLIAPAVVAIVVIILILQNTSEDWRFHFFFWWVSLPAWLMLVVLLVGGFLDRDAGEHAAGAGADARPAAAPALLNRPTELDGAGGAP